MYVYCIHTYTYIIYIYLFQAELAGPDGVVLADHGGELPHARSEVRAQVAKEQRLRHQKRKDKNWVQKTG